MKSTWTAGLKEEEKTILIADYKSAHNLLNRLKYLLNKKDNSADKKSRDEKAFENPNWELHQAYTIGYRRAINEIISLIN
jgi:hypothetical protein